MKYKLFLIPLAICLVAIAGYMFFVDNGCNVQNVDYTNFEDDLNVESKIDTSYMDGDDLIIEYTSSEEKVWIEGLPPQRYLIDKEKIIIYNYKPSEVFQLHIGEESDIYTFGTPIGYRFINDSIHMWNTQDSYYFNKSSGIQFTNHYEDYWTKNVFCIGYYSGEEWVKIKCADELDNFNKNITTDNETYVNATFWKDITYGGYNMRLGVRYHLGLDDDLLSIIIYGKNLGLDDIPFDLGFAWKVKDIQINLDENDWIVVNKTRYYLNENLDYLFKNMTTYSENYGWTTSSYYVLKDTSGKYIKVRWNPNLNYAVKLFSDSNQTNSYVSLLINAGLFSSGQEKLTTFYWQDPEGDYVSNFSISGDMTDETGLARNGTDIWITSRTDTQVYHYTDAGVDIDNFDTGASGSNAPEGICEEGDYLGVVDTSSDSVYIFFKNGTFSSSFALGSGVYWGLGCDANYFYVSHGNVKNVSIWGWDGVLVDSFVPSEVGITDIEGITVDDDWVFVLCNINDEVYKYNKTSPYTYNSSWDTAGSGNTNPGGIGLAGNYFDLTDRDDHLVYRYEGPLIGDTIKPTYSGAQTNNTVASEITTFAIEYNDDTALNTSGQYIFSTNNTGTWTNESAVSFTSTPEWANVSKVLNSTAGTIVGYRWFADDNAGNVNNTEIYVVNVTAVPDSTPPTFITIPSNVSLNYGTDWGGVWFNATDETAFDTYDVNDTRFTINETGYLLNSSDLAYGNYLLNISIKDTAGNTNCTVYHVEINQSTVSCQVYFNESSPLTYPDIFTVMTNCTSAYTLTVNGSSILNNSVQNSGAGAYNFTVQRTDNVNYSNIYDEEEFQIAKAITAGSLAGTTPLEYGNNGDVTGTETNNGDGDLTYLLYRNGTSVSNPDTTALEVGYYHYIYNTTGGANYTTNASIDIFDLIVQDTTPPQISFEPQTLADYSNVSQNFIYSNVSLTESNFEDMSYNLFSSSINTTGLVGYWNFDRNSTTQRDLSGEGNDGTVSGATWTGPWTILNFDTTTGFDVGVLSTERMEGNSSLNVSTGVSQYNIIATYTGQDIDVSSYANSTNMLGDNYLTFWAYVENSSLITSGGITSFEFGNANNVNQTKWSNQQLQDGWNYVTLNFNESSYQNLATINWSEVDYIQMYAVNSTSVLPRILIDDLQIHHSDEKLFGAYDFNRSQYISIIDDDNLTFSNTTGMTLSFWARSIDAGNWIGFGSGSNYRHILGKGGWGNYEYWIRQVNGSSGGSFVFTVSNGSASVTTSSQISNAFPDDSWFYFTVGMNNTHTFAYKNGVLIDSDSLNPTITFENGNSDLNIGRRSNDGLGLYFNGSIDEVMIYNRSLFQDEITNLYNRQALYRNVLTTKTYEMNWTSLMDGTYNYFVDILDTLGNYNFTEIRNILLDDTFPLISYNSNTDVDNSNSSKDWIFINITASDTNKDIIILNWNGTNETFDNIDGNIYWENKTSLADGIYTFYSWINDTSGNVNQTLLRTITLDITAPAYTIITPLNDTYYNESEINITTNLTDNLGIQNATYYIFNETHLVNETTTSFLGNVKKYTLGIVFVLVDGAYKWFVAVTDWAGNLVQSDNQTLTIDTEFPPIEFVNPTPLDNSNQTYNSIYVNYTTSDENDRYSFINFDSSLVGWWRFEGNANDESGQGNDGTIYNATLVSNGRFGQAFEFDGDGDYVNASNSVTLQLDENLTLSAWIKIDSANDDSGYHNILSKSSGGTTNREYNFYVKGNGSGGWALHFSATNSSQLSAFGSIGNYIMNRNEWNHVVAIRNTDNDGQNMYYINGILDSNHATSFGDSFKSSGNLLIGKRDNLFNGSIDEVMIFNRSLSSEEIMALYNASLPYYNYTELNQDSTHTFKSYVIDQAGNKNETELRTITIDTFTPQFSSFDSSPANNSEYYPGQLYKFNSTITSTNGTVGFEFEGVTYTANNHFGGNIYNITLPSDLPIGTYSYNWFSYGNGSLTRYNETAVFAYSVNQNTTSCQIYFNDTSPLTYPDIFIIYTNCSSTYTLAINGTSVSNNTAQVLATGAYNFSVTRTDNVNYSNIYDEEEFQIFIGSTAGSISGTSLITYPTASDVEGTESNSGDGDVVYKLYRNGTEVSNPDNDLLAVGYYTYIYNNTAGTNYTADVSLDTFNLEVDINTSSGNLTLNGTDTNKTIYRTDIVLIEGSLTVGTGNIYIFINDTLFDSGASPLSDTEVFNTLGYYEVNLTYLGNENYTSFVEYLYVNVTANPFADIIIFYPLEEIYTSHITELNYTVVNYTNCWYNLGEGGGDIPIVCGTNVTGISSVKDLNTWTVFVNNTDGVISSDSVTFRITLPYEYDDLTKKIIQILQALIIFAGIWIVMMCIKWVYEGEMTLGRLIIVCIQVSLGLIALLFLGPILIKYLISVIK